MGVITLSDCHPLFEGSFLEATSVRLGGSPYLIDYCPILSRQLRIQEHRKEPLQVRQHVYVPCNEALRV